jgi:TfoX/Sxy family transcriptional regulator of competence genes
MAYDEELAHRVREQLADEDGVTEKAMFGGLAFLLQGNMAVTVSSRGGLMVRVGAEGAADALARPHTKQIEMRGRPMTGWIHVAGEGVRTKRQLGPWVRRGLQFTRTLAPKRSSGSRPRRARPPE